MLQTLHGSSLVIKSLTYARESNLYKSRSTILLISEHCFPAAECFERRSITVYVSRQLMQYFP